MWHAGKPLDGNGSSFIPKPALRLKKTHSERHCLIETIEIYLILSPKSSYRPFNVLYFEGGVNLGD